jgi:hypothetical protein
MHKKNLTPARHNPRTYNDNKWIIYCRYDAFPTSHNPFPRRTHLFVSQTQFSKTILFACVFYKFDFCWNLTVRIELQSSAGKSNTEPSSNFAKTVNLTMLSNIRRTCHLQSLIVFLWVVIQNSRPPGHDISSWPCTGLFVLYASAQVVVSFQKPVQ